MTSFYLFQIDHANVAPEHAKEAAHARMGQVYGTFARDMHTLVNLVDVEDLDQLLTVESPFIGQLNFGDVAVDAETLNARALTTCGWEELSWDHSTRFSHRAAAVETGFSGVRPRLDLMEPA